MDSREPAQAAPTRHDRAVATALVCLLSGAALLDGVVALGFFSADQHLVSLVGLLVLAAGILIGAGLFMPWSLYANGLSHNQ